jgi:hypothetical protein
MHAAGRSGNDGGNEGNDGNNGGRSTDGPDLEPEPTTPPSDEPAPAPEPLPETVEPEEPLPYCDTSEGEAALSCHDRYDYDEETGLYPCNDGRQVSDPLDCTTLEEPCPAYPATGSTVPPGCPSPSSCKGVAGTSDAEAEAEVCPPPLKPPFDPDRDCMFDPDLPKCIPGPGKKCPAGFGIT